MRATLDFVLQTSARLLRLLSLFQSRRFWTGAELAERLEVTDRTLRRDVDRLRTLGYPVHATSGVAGGYQLGAGAALPPLLLEDDEALAVSIALGSSASGTVTGIDEAALRALVKLEQVLPARLRRRANALRASIVSLQRAGPAVDSTLLVALAGACRDHEQLAFQYQGGRAPEGSERLVEPLGLVHTGYRWYLVAWDVNRGDFRTFRVDRMTGKATVGARFLPRPPPDGGDLRAYVARSISSAPYTFQARVLLHAPLEQVAERIPPGAGLLEKVSAERCRLQTGSHSLSSLALWIGLIGVDFEVEAPAELVVELGLLHARLGRALPDAEHGEHETPVKPRRGRARPAR